jgi:hypothetical protein
MISVKEIRQQYPNPRALAYGEAKVDDGYCVLGALLRCVDNMYASFPSSEFVIPVLVTMNPTLSYQRAQDYCFRIMEMNDTYKDFEAAWAELDKALKDGQSGGADDHS